MTDFHLDYFFLTDVARRVDSSIKGINDFPAWNSPHLVDEATLTKKRDVPNYLQTLIKQAEQRKVHLISLPLGMSRQKENQTRYLFSKGIIMWYSKWVLSGSSPALTFTTKASELSTVGETFMTKLNSESVCSFYILFCRAICIRFLLNIKKLVWRELLFF